MTKLYSINRLNDSNNIYIIYCNTYIQILLLSFLVILTVFRFICIFLKICLVLDNTSPHQTVPPKGNFIFKSHSKCLLCPPVNIKREYFLRHFFFCIDNRGRRLVAYRWLPPFACHSFFQFHDKHAHST